MPHAMHEKLKAKYGAKSKVPYKVMAKMEKQHGSGVAGMMKRKKG